MRVNAFVTDRNHVRDYMAARDAVFEGLPPPASTLVVVSGFARPEFLVEVEAVAAVAPPRPPRRARGRAPPRWRRGYSTGARAFSTTAARPSSKAVAACVASARDAGVNVFALADGDANRTREITRRSRATRSSHSTGAEVIPGDPPRRRRDPLRTPRRRRDPLGRGYSPILAKKLEGLVADAVAFCKTEADVLAVVAVAVAHGVPVTPRGAGAGNYGSRAVRKLTSGSVRTEISERIFRNTHDH